MEDSNAIRNLIQTLWRVWVSDVRLYFNTDVARSVLLGVGLAVLAAPILALRSRTGAEYPRLDIAYRCRLPENPSCLEMQLLDCRILFWSNVDNVARTWCTLTTRASILWISTKLMQFIAFLNLSLLQFNCCPPSLRLCNSPQVAILPRDSQMIVLFYANPSWALNSIEMHCVNWLTHIDTL